TELGRDHGEEAVERLEAEGGARGLEATEEPVRRRAVWTGGGREHLARGTHHQEHLRARVAAPSKRGLGGGERGARGLGRERAARDLHLEKGGSAPGPARARWKR